jgi:hypothetical protein
MTRLSKIHPSYVVDATSRMFHCWCLHLAVDMISSFDFAFPMLVIAILAVLDLPNLFSLRVREPDAAKEIFTSCITSSIQLSPGTFLLFGMLLEDL